MFFKVRLFLPYISLMMVKGKSEQCVYIK